MTALRFFATGKPSLIGAKVLPMSKEDERFWTLLRAMRASPEGTRREAAWSPKAIARGDAQSAAGAQNPLHNPLYSRGTPDDQG